MITRGLKMVLVRCIIVEKTVDRVETHSLSSKLKVSGTDVSNEGHVDCFLAH